MTQAASLDAVGRTALVTAAMRAAETQRPDALHQDPYAATLAGDLGPQLLAELLGTPARLEAEAGATTRYNAIRTHFFDTYLHDAVTEAGLRQIVVPGAGMDARLYRMTWPEGVRYFEVDRPAVLDYKRDRLSDVPPQADHRVVRTDLTAPSWPDALIDAGYDPDQPSAWLLEGLLPYLPVSGVQQLLDQVARLAAPGSRIAADLVNEAALEAMPGREVFARWGCPWLSACDDPEKLFGRSGFDADIAQPAGLGEDFEQGETAGGSDPDVPRVFLVTGRRA
jgi:methyltransferase (TIGR00027 family)